MAVEYLRECAFGINAETRDYNLDSRGKREERK